MYVLDFIIGTIVGFLLSTVIFTGIIRYYISTKDDKY